MTKTMKRKKNRKHKRTQIDSSEIIAITAQAMSFAMTQWKVFSMRGFENPIICFFTANDRGVPVQAIPSIQERLAFWFRTAPEICTSKVSTFVFAIYPAPYEKLPPTNVPVSAEIQDCLRESKMIAIFRWDRNPVPQTSGGGSSNSSD